MEKGSFRVGINKLNKQTNNQLIEINEDNDYIIVNLIDNGTGVSDTKKIMTPYFTTKKKGTGLGLPIVSKIINEHSGELLITNNINDGIDIKITFPIIHE